MLLKLWRELNRVRVIDRLPRLPNTFRMEYEELLLTNDDQLLLGQNHAVDLMSARRLMKEAGYDNAMDYCRDHRRAPVKPNRRRRLLNWLRRIEGSTGKDATIERYLKLMRESGKYKGGVYEISLD